MCILYFWQTEAEVKRLKKLKASRMKELVLKRRSELEEICREAHIEPDMSTAQEKLFAMIDSGGVFFFLCPMKLKVIDLRLLLMLFACRPCGCV